MTHEALAPPVLPPGHQAVAADVVVDTTTVPSPTEEQVRAADHVFAQRQDESQQVKALLGLYTGVLLGHQLLVETFQRQDEREEAERKDDPKRPDPEE